MKRFYCPIVFLIFILAACSAGGGADPDSLAPVSVSMKIPVASKASAVSNKVGEGVQSIAARVLNSADSPADAPQEENVQPNDEVSFDFSVLPGQITFIVEAYSGQNSQGTLLFRGEETENIVPGTNPAIQILMQPVVETEAIPVTPKTVDVPLLGSENFTVDVSGLIDPTLEWQVEGIKGGNPQVGTISADGNTGLYTAPAQFPGKNSVTVKVVDRSDPSKFGTATVNLQNANFTVSPRAAIVEKTGSQVFSVSGIDPSDVFWGVNGVPGGNDALGTIDSAGNYVGPIKIPIDGPDEGSTPLGVPKTINVEAASQSQPPSVDMASVKVVTGRTLTFEANRQVTPANTGSRLTTTQSSGQRNIVFYEGRVFVTWIKVVNGERTAVYSESEDGLAWMLPTPVLGVGPDSQEGAAAAVGPDGSVYVVFTDCGPCASAQSIRLAVRRPQETVFSEIPLVMPANILSLRDPSVAVAPDGSVFVAWAMDQARESASGLDIVLQRIGSDGSLIDQMPKNLTEAAGAMSQAQSVLSIAPDGTVFVAWIEFDPTTGTGVLIATGSSDKGETFRPPALVSEGLLSSNRPTIAAGPSVQAGTARRVYLAWEGIASTASQNPIVYFNTGTLGASGAIAFDVAEPVGSFSPDMNRQISPSLAWDGAGGIYLAVHEVFSGFDFGGLFLGKRLDEDSTFASFEKIDDDAQNRHGKQYPSVTVDSAGRAFAAWTDTRGGEAPNNYVWFAQGE